MRRRVKWFMTVAVLCALLAGAALFVPWNATIEGQIKSALQKAGLSNVGLSVSEIGSNRFALRDIAFQKKPADVAIQSILLSGESDFTPLVFGQDKDWSGKWEVKGLSVASLALPKVPLLDGEGTAVLRRDKVHIEGVFASADRSHLLDFNVMYDAGKPDEALFTVRKALFPWNGGNLRTKNVDVSLTGKKPIRLTLEVQGVLLDNLMQLLTSNRANATGTVSGTLPLTISPQGEITVHDAKLSASDKGNIKLAADAIPGAGEQVSVVRNILSDFHYETLAISANSGKDDKLSILLSLSGNNPAAYNGRVVKLNVNLQGDMLDLIQNSILPLSDVKQLLKRGE